MTASSPTGIPMTEPSVSPNASSPLTQCSRREAEQYIEGGWVRVDGEVVEEPQFMVDTQDRRTSIPMPRLIPTEPATLVLHKPAGYDAGSGPNRPAHWSRPTTARPMTPPACAR